MRRKLLLHHCCAPCSPRVVAALRREYDVESFWFNPNIQPEDELARRKQSMDKLAEILGLALHGGPEYPQETWLKNLPARAEPERCRFCYRLRLEWTAEEARRRGMECFSTTLLSSPYQKHELVAEAGREAAAGTGRSFVYRDFRPDYYEGKNEAYRMGMYLQKYCGCIFSRDERAAAKKGGRP